MKVNNKNRMKLYYKLLRSKPELFGNSEGAQIKILHEENDIRLAQKFVKKERVNKNWDTNDLRVGVLASDPYLGYLVRDAVAFSDGKYGLYNRVISIGGVIVLPILNNSIVLINIFRHSSRRSFLEAPQGHIVSENNLENDVRRELQEEIGSEPVIIEPLGKIYTSTGLTSERLKAFTAEITSIGLPQREEGITDIIVIPNSEIDDYVKLGIICDGPTLSVIYLARLMKRLC